MDNQADVLIIGGGVIGVCAAYYLAGQGPSVVLVEQHEICAGCSYGNAGLIVPSHSLPLAAPGALAKGLGWLLDGESPFYIKPRPDLSLLAWLLTFSLACREGPVRRAIPLLRDLSLASRALYDELAAQEGFDFGYRRSGTLAVYTTRHGYEEGIEEAHLLSGYGVVAEVLDAAQVLQREPNIRPGVVGGVFFPADAHLKPAEFVRGLAVQAERKGVCIRPNTEVIGFVTSGRQVVGVTTTRGMFRAAQVVLAAGAWSPLVARELRLRLPIQAAKGYSLTFTRPTACPSVPLLLGEAHVAVTPMGDVLRLGGTLELAGHDFTINTRRVRAIQRRAGQYLDGLEHTEPLEVWRGLRPCTPDGLPIIGRVSSFDNVIVAAGHAMVGMSLGPITGRLVAQLACGQPPEIELAALRPDRFN